MNKPDKGIAIINLIESVSKMADATDKFLEIESKVMQIANVPTQGYRSTLPSRCSLNTVQNIANIRVAIQHTLDRVKSLAQNIK